MSLEALLAAAAVLGAFVVTLLVLRLLRLLLRFGQEGGIDVVISVAFWASLWFVLLVGAKSTVSWLWLAGAGPLWLVGLLLVSVGLFETPTVDDRGERRDDLVIVGGALLTTAFVVFFLLGVEPHELFSDLATSVSNAPN